MNLYLIRHTSVAVPPGVCYGQADVPVAKTFHAEKDKLVAQLSEIQVDTIYSSPLSRCKVLAEELFGTEKITFDNRLMELNFGDWELKTWDEIYHTPQGKTWMDQYQTAPTLNGESFAQMVIRVSDFFSDITSQKTENVAIVTHAGVIRILKSLIDNQPIAEVFKTFNPDYGSLTQLHYSL